jgi:beta-galactosidase/beta-glucuronidase
MYRTLCLALLSLSALPAQEFTRGIGVYPGNPAEDFSPTLQPSPVRRNLALHRPAYHSSSYDYNLTAQLITDGIITTETPRWITVYTSQQGALKKNAREWVLDDNWVSAIDLRGRQTWVRIDLHGAPPPTIDALKIDVTVRAPGADNQDWTITIQGSNDNKTWLPLGVTAGMARPTGEIHATVPLAKPANYKKYRVQFDSGRALNWQVGEVSFWNKSQRVHVGGPYDFTSTWMSGATREEWVSVDLGTVSEFDQIKLHWLRPAAEGALQTSNDGQQWTTLQPLPSGNEIKLAQPAKARWLRVLMTKPAAPEGYLLSELEVFGTGGLVPQPKPAPSYAHSRQNLAAGSWKLERASQVTATPAALSQPGFADQTWLAATVPGTILASYLNAGAIPDPNYADNQNMISDAYFYSDFWYRHEFNAPPVGRRAWLNFDGINWKADVYFNGEKLGRIEGAFTRARFDVTNKIKPGARNALAVLIIKNATPGSIKEKTYENPDKNGGALGADNPTYHASIGWDWIPTIRGRNTGIWNDVYLTTTAAVTLDDPQVQSQFTDPSQATVTLTATARNQTAAPANGVWKGRFGDQTFELPVTLAANAEQLLTKQLTIPNPKLWWPAGYGAPNLYEVQLQFVQGNNVSDSKTFQAGIRQFTYSEEGHALKFWINGRRFIPKGGNWGFGESMLRYRGREYDAAVRYHADQHFNMIRNWVGQIGDDEFYEACDRHGIVVMQDFWLANPWDGPEPDDNSMFMRNVNDTILRIRSHPSIGLYCGRNEGYPLKPLDDSIRAALKQHHPGIHYVSSSADDVVSGHGPYQAMSFEYYFTERATKQFHSEMGMPNIVTMDSLEAMMPRQAMWPQGAMWGLHDFCLGGAQGGASYQKRLAQSYGGANNIEDWVSLAQFINYEGHRAMFEAQSQNRMGLLIWMSHPTWPSMVWQTYDYYLEPTAAYFGAKKAAEPLHIQWNPYTESIEVVNYSAGNLTGLMAQIDLINMDGKTVQGGTYELESKEDSVFVLQKMKYPEGLTPVHFISLRLLQNGKIVSQNFYWRGLEANNFRALRDLPKVELTATTKIERQGNQWKLITTLANPAARPALMVRLKAVRETTGDRILPAIYSDNYIALMPGEQRIIETEVNQTDTRGEKPAIAVEGFNSGSFRSK